MHLSHFIESRDESQACLQGTGKMTCCRWSKNFPTGRKEKREKRKEKEKENVQLKRSLSRLLIIR